MDADSVDALALSNDGEAVVMSDHGRIAGVSCHVDYKRGKGYLTVCPQREGNARIIAASPTMYEYVLRRAEEGDAEAKAIVAEITKEY